MRDQGLRCAITAAAMIFSSMFAQNRLALGALSGNNKSCHPRVSSCFAGIRN